MNAEKLQSILKAMEGITYLEWSKLKMSIDNCFSAEFSKQNKATLLAEPNKIVKEYRHYSSTI